MATFINYRYHVKIQISNVTLGMYDRAMVTWNYAATWVCDLGLAKASTHFCY